jgi:photosystem II stability/assembly factor-like uncharacterized protein
MRRRLLIFSWISLSLMLSSCTDNVLVGALSPPVTGWVIGQSTDDAEIPNPTAQILKTVDGGATWTLQTLPAEVVGFNGNDISSVTDDVAWAAVGDLYDLAGGILHTGDGGATWTLQTLPDGLLTTHIKCIKGVSPTEAWAVSILGDVLHTTDAGITWTSVEVKDAENTPITMHQVNRMDVLGQDIWIADAAGGDRSVIHSLDGGATWRQELLPEVAEGSGLLSLSAFDSSNVWVGVHNDGRLWGTSDGGSAWSISNDTIAGLTDFDDMCATSANVVWVAQNNGVSSGGIAARITVTDGNFETNSTTFGTYMMEGVSAMSDNETAWIVGLKTIFADAALPHGAIYFTQDGGVTWQAQTVPDNALDVDFWKISFVGARR